MRRFNGEINGKRLSDFNSLNNDAETLKERKAHLEELLGDADFFTTYFNEYYKAFASQTDHLAEGDMVCRSLEIMGSYLIGSKDIDNHRDIEHRFWKDERNFNGYKESKVMTTLNAAVDSGEGNSVEMIETLSGNEMDKNKIEVTEDVEREIEKILAKKVKEKNQRVVKPIFVTINDKKMIEEIKDLENYIKFISSEGGRDHVLKCVRDILEKNVDDSVKSRCRYISKNVERYIRSLVKDLRENQLAIKKAITRPIEFKNILKGEGAPNKLDAIDFMEKKHVKLLLPYLSQQDAMTELGMTIWDLNVLIDGTKLSKTERKVIDLYRQGYKQVEIAEEIGANQSNVTTYENRIAIKVARTHEGRVELYRKLKRNKKV